MTRPPSPPLRRRRALPLLLVLVLGAGLAACTSGPPPPDTTAQAFLDGLSSGDSAVAAQVTDAPTAAEQTLDEARASLQPESVQTGLEQVRTSGDTAIASFTATWTLPQEREWTYSGELPLARAGEGWVVRWSAADLHPRLSSNQTLAVRTEAAPTASVLDADGAELLTPSTVIRVVLDPAAAGDVPAVAVALAEPLSALAPEITRQSILDGVAAAEGEPYSVATLREADYRSVRDAIDQLPGVSFPTEARLLSVQRDLAPTLLSQVQEQVETDLAGAAGWRVVTTSPTGADVAVLSETAAEPAPAVRLTLDRDLQAVAQDAVNARTEATVLVAVRPSTGELLAVAQNDVANAEGPVALSGLYPPGSTFKIATASAALQAGLITAQTPVGCPASTVVYTRRLSNYDDFDLGTVSLEQAFAASCNTTFAQLGAQLGPDGLTDAALQLGIGSDYDLPGARTLTGSVPASTDEVQRAEDAIGQGQVLVSPLSMALAAATVARGAVPVPTLIEGTDTGVAAPPPTLSEATLGVLRPLMRAVVTSGTATELNGFGDVFGKTGEAQFGDGTRSHAWFTGYRGDLAFATLVVGGGSSTNAVAVTGALLATLPAGY